MPLSHILNNYLYKVLQLGDHKIGIIYYNLMNTGISHENIIIIIITNFNNGKWYLKLRNELSERCYSYKWKFGHEIFKPISSIWTLDLIGLYN